MAASTDIRSSSAAVSDAARLSAAMLNILEDATAERAQLGDAQRAVLNILEDASTETQRADDARRALVNILDDASIERRQLADAQRAVMNILEDASAETDRVDEARRALLNILDDSAHEVERLADSQKAMINILDDFNIEKTRVEDANERLRSEVAERQRAEQALQVAKGALESANKELEAFSYSVAHDLRAPLRGIDGFSQALVEDYGQTLDERAKEYLGYVRKSAQQMAHLIDDLLALSRVTRSPLNRRAIDLAPIARRIMSALQEREPGRSVEVRIAAALPATGDAGLVAIAMQNLLDNAWKFTGKTERALIEVGADSNDTGSVFFVRDNGAGFNMAYAEKLFGAFQRLHTSSEFDGTGIGLALVDRIIRRHGGHISAVGAPGRGATFSFTLGE